MKTFTARQLGNNRAEMRQEIRNGGCILQYKNSDRTVDMECVMVPMDEYKRMARLDVFVLDESPEVLALLKE